MRAWAAPVVDGERQDASEVELATDGLTVLPHTLPWHTIRYRLEYEPGEEIPTSDNATDGGVGMSARVEAAAKVMHAQDSVMEDVGEFNPWVYEHDAKEILAAADAVMFSDEAIERAATISGHKPSVVRAIAKALKGAGDE